MNFFITSHTKYIQYVQALTKSSFIL